MWLRPGPSSESLVRSNRHDAVVNSAACRLRSLRSEMMTKPTTKIEQGDAARHQGPVAGALPPAGRLGRRQPLLPGGRGPGGALARRRLPWSEPPAFGPPADLTRAGGALAAAGLAAAGLAAVADLAATPVDFAAAGLAAAADLPPTVFVAPPGGVAAAGLDVVAEGLGAG